MLGTGSTCVCHLCVRKGNKKAFACKVVDRRRGGPSVLETVHVSCWFACVAGTNRADPVNRQKYEYYNPLNIPTLSMLKMFFKRIPEFTS